MTTFAAINSLPRLGGEFKTTSRTRVRQLRCTESAWRIGSTQHLRSPLKPTRFVGAPEVGNNTPQRQGKPQSTAGNRLNKGAKRSARTEVVEVVVDMKTIVVYEKITTDYCSSAVLFWMSHAGGGVYRSAAGGDTPQRAHRLWRDTDLQRLPHRYRLQIPLSEVKDKEKII